MKPEINKLLDNINGKFFARKTAGASESGDEKVYSDEPVLKTASQLNKYTPEKIIEMRKLGRTLEKSRREIFYTQAVFMKDYTDDCPYHSVIGQFLPSYETLTNAQLRGYFTWRTRFRNGDVDTNAPFVFMFLYASEIVNGVGVASAQDGYDILSSLVSEAEKNGGEFSRVMSSMLQDYVVYYGLSPLLLSDKGDSGLYRLLDRVFRCREYADDELFEAVKELSFYNVGLSRFYKKYPDDLKYVVCSVIRHLTELCDEKNKQSFFETMFGTIVKVPYRMFPQAPFYEKTPHVNCEYIAGPFNTYTCKNGIWSITKIYSLTTKSRPLGDIVKASEASMRKKYGFRYPMKSPAIGKYEKQSIEKAIDGLLRKKEEEKINSVRIDISALDTIRSSAERTCEMLLTDDERSAENPSESNSGARSVTDSMAYCCITDTFRDEDTSPSGKSEKNTEAGSGKSDCFSENCSNDTYGISCFDFNKATVVSDNKCLVFLSGHLEHEKSTCANSGCVLDIISDGKMSNQIEKNSIDCPSSALLEYEQEFIKALLNDSEYRSIIKKAGSTPELVVDSINEKLYDRFMDTVIIYEGDKPRIVDDYTDELKGLIV